MPKLSLRPFAFIEEGLDQYLGYNFTRLENVFERISDSATGSQLVTGTMNIATGLARVDGVTASLEGAPVAGACFVRSAPGAAAGSIDITIYSSTFIISVIAAAIRWIAVGELILS